MGLNLKHAQYIMEIIKEGSITNASKTMHVSQPALSQTIKAVEKYLGAPIFLRNTKPIVLTEAGKKYIAAVKKIITISTNLLHEVSDIQYEGYGTLRLGIPIQRAMQMLPRVMPVFRQRYPHIKLEIKEAGSNITEKSVLNGDVDIAIMTTSPGNDELIYELVETEDVVLVANKLTMLAQRIDPGVPIHITEAKNEDFISITEGHNVRRVQDTLLTSTTSNPIWSLKQAASKWESGLSAAWMPSSSVLTSTWTIISWNKGTVSFIRSWALPISATVMSAQERTRT